MNAIFIRVQILPLFFYHRLSNRRHPHKLVPDERPTPYSEWSEIPGIERINIYNKIVCNKLILKYILQGSGLVFWSYRKFLETFK